MNNKIQKPVNIAVEVQDTRDVSNPKLIFHKLNTLTLAMMGGFTAKQPVAVTITQALQQGLTQMNYHVEPGASNTLRCQIVAITTHPAINKYYLQIKLDVKAYRGTTSVWHRVIIGTGSTGFVFVSKQVARTVFSKALTNAVRQLQHSKSFNQALAGKQ